MTAPAEVVSPTKESIGQTALPSLEWPMNRGVLMSPRTRITYTDLGEGPGLIIQTPPGSAFSIRAPISGRMQQITGLEEDSLTTVILMPDDDPSVMVVLGNLASSTSEQELQVNEAKDPDAAMEVRAGQIIGSYGSTEKGLTMQIAHISEDTTTGSPQWELVDPSEIKILPLLKKNS